MGTIIIALFKPQIKVKGHSINIFFSPALIGALFLIFSNVLPFEDVAKGLTADIGINPIKILALFLSMTLISIFLDETGFFRYLANIAVQKCNGKQIKLFVIFFFMVSGLTIFTSNDVVILTLTPFMCYFAKNANINPIPYLFSEFIAANTASMLLIIGNPTNIYLGTMADINFFDYMQVMYLPSILATTTAFLILLILFKKQLAKPIIVTIDRVQIKDKTYLTYSLLVMAICTITLSISGFIKIQMWLISTIAFFILVLGILLISLIKRKKPVELLMTIQRAPWEVIPLVLSMFIIVLALGNSRTTEMIAELLNKNHILLIYGVTSTFTANIINNIPMSVLYSSIIVESGQGVTATYASIIGSNIGAYLTPIGALAGIMWLNILRNQGINFKFKNFMAYGVCVAIPALFAALLGLIIVIG